MVRFVGAIITQEFDWASEPDLDELYRLYNLLKSDRPKAVSGLELLAERGSVASMLYLGEAFIEEGPYQDLEKAKYWYGKADQAGSRYATYTLGRLHLRAHEYRDAFAAFSRGADRGDLPSICRLGRMYQDGVGTSRDLERARELFLEGYRNGHLIAKRSLAHLYLSGRFGVLNFFRGLTLFLSLVGDTLRWIYSSLRYGEKFNDRMIG